jgi:hypothetical protein
MLDRWRVGREIVRNQFNVDYAEIVGSGVLLLVGGLMLGYGLASFANVAAGFALSTSGGVMLFAGILMGTRSLIAVSHALESVAKANYAKDIQEKTNDLHETKFTYANLHNQVERVQNEIKYVVSAIKKRGLRF